MTFKEHWFTIFAFSVSIISSGYTIGMQIDSMNILEINQIREQESFATDKLSMMLYDVKTTDDINFEPSDDMFKPLTYHCSGAMYDMTVGNPEFENGRHLIIRCEPDSNIMSGEVDIINRAWDSALHSFSSVGVIEN